MSGSRDGGLKAAQKNLAKDPDFYKKIGARGGKNGNTGGFATLEVGDDGLTGRERARIAGQRGGRKSKRSPIIKLEALEIDKVVPDSIKVAVMQATDQTDKVAVRRPEKRKLFAEIRRMFL